ncbi:MULTISPECIES: polysaccharide deacetylase family protein [Mesorhizobium]|nr:MULTISPECIES: polysaccharide deacetylase family protein [Mesorhizobium]
MTDHPNMRMALRYAGIRVALEAIGALPAAVARAPWSGRGLIFTLHHVRPPDSNQFQPNALLSITPEFLDAALKTALDSGLIPVRLEDILALESQGEAGRFFAVTLDDGYRDNAEHAAPIFRRYGVPYTIFATSGFVQRSCAPWWETAERLLQQSEKIRIDLGHGQETFNASTNRKKSALFGRIADFVKTYDEDVAVGRIDAAAKSAGIDPYALVSELVMDAAELRKLIASDPLLSIGAHTVTHCNLRRVDPRRLHEEISDSVSAIELITGRKPTTFAYPYGWSSAASEREARAVEACGVSLAVTTMPGMLRRGRDNYLLPRISLNGLFQQPRYVRALISGLPFLFR